jgi:hypothetical protein
MVFNPDGTIARVMVDKYGVGQLGKAEATRTNLAAKATLTASSHKEPKTVKAQIIPNPNGLTNLRVNTREGDWVERTFTYMPQNAADCSNGTRWWAADDDTAPWLMLDLGKKVRVAEVSIDFIFPTLGHAWKLEKSANGKTWTTCALGDKTVLCAPQKAFGVGNTRYLRLHITNGKAGVYEIKVY